MPSTSGTKNESPRCIASLLSPCCQGGKIESRCASSAEYAASGRKIAATSAAAPRTELRILVSSRRIVKAGLLQLRNSCDNSGGQHHAVDEMVGKLGGHSLVRCVIRVLTGGNELRGDLPDRVMASHEHDATLLERGDGVADRAEHTV